nr:lipase family protein [Rhodococcus sp. (in: high G+C Gram-positive bacteria)]
MRINSLTRSLAVAAALTVLTAAAATGTAAAQPAAPTVPQPVPSADPFYDWDGAPAGDGPGSVLRTRPAAYGAPNVPTPIVSTQVLYRTTNQQDEPVATVATVLRPLIPGPAKLISFHPAYDGLGSECDPSYTLSGHGNSRTASIEQAVITGYMAAGFTVVVPDYEGEQLEWTIGRQSAYAALDGIRAAESVLGLPSSTPVGLIGYSGGSVPTQWGAEIAPQYAPELNIVGAAAGGLPVDLAHNLPYVSGSKDWAGVIPALIVAYQRAYGIDTDAFLSAKGKQIVNAVQGNCINDFASDYPGLTDTEMLLPEYASLLDVPEVVEAIDDNIMGSTGTPRVPILLGVGDSDGTGDTVMVTADVEGLAHEYCGRGVAVTYAQYNGQSHSDAFIPFQAQSAQFLNDRFNGAAPMSNCAVVGPGNDLSPTPIP